VRRAEDRSRNDWRAGVNGQPAGAVMRRAEGVGLIDSRPLGEHDQQAVLLEYGPSREQRFAIMLTALHRERSEAREQPAHRALEYLGLCHEAHVAMCGEAEEEGVEEALVVRRDDRGPVSGHVLGARDSHAEP